MTFLGLEIDSDKGDVRAPGDKVQVAVNKIMSVLSADSVTLREMQSLVGTLSYLCKPIPSGRGFLRRLYDAMAVSPTRLDINGDIKEDLLVWL